MPWTAGELSLIQNRTPKAPGGHKCRGGCGGRLHGIGELEGPDSDTPFHRSYPACLPVLLLCLNCSRPR